MVSPWVRNYISLTDFLGKTLGPDYEVALYDLSTAEGAIIALANGHLTHRGVGAPLPPLEQQWLSERRAGRGEERINATSMAATGTLLRSSCWLIRQPAGEPAAMLVINFDDGRYRDLSARILRLRHPDAFVDSHFAVLQELSTASAPVAASPADLAEAALHAAAPDVADMTRLNHRERRTLVSNLDARGFFLLKGAVRLLAQRFACSVASVYRYRGGR